MLSILAHICEKYLLFDSDTLDVCYHDLEWVRQYLKLLNLILVELQESRYTCFVVLVLIICAVYRNNVLVLMLLL